MVFHGGMLLPLRSELQSVENITATHHTLTSRKSKLLDDDKMMFFHAHESTRPTGWIDKLQQAGFCMTDASHLSITESIKCFRSSLKAPSKLVIEQLCASSPKVGVHLMSKMQELCDFAQTSDKPIQQHASESAVQLILNDIHAAVMELDESLLDTSTGTDAATKVACSDWLKQVQAYVLYLQKQLAALAAAADEEQLEDTWLNLVHEMGVSFQNVVSEVKSSGVTVAALDSSSRTAPSRRARRVVRSSHMPYSHWAKRVAI